MEWDLFIKKCATFCSFDTTPARIFESSYSEAEIQTIFEKTELFFDQELYEEILAIRLELGGLEKQDLAQKPGAQLSKGAIFELDKLATVISALESVLDHNKFLMSLAAHEYNDRDKDFRNFFKNKVLREFRTFVSREGEIDFFRHPKLKALHKKQLELEANIRSTLSHLRNSEHYQSALQFSGHDIVNDKYVLPIKSDHFSSGLGVIVARSESGRTLYVEPGKVRALNSERFETLLKIDQIIHEIARDFCQRLAQYSDLIDHYIFLLQLFDEFDCRSKFAIEFNLTRPAISKHPTIKLDGFFHPLIKNPVKNDLDIEVNYKGLLISGPNTGGKTAAIKAVALCGLFAKKGLFIPAQSGTFHLFENIFYFGNDQQSLPEGLSSFAAETQNYAKLLNQLGDSNLIIIDEIFNSTSSEEASALALALFNELTKDQHTKVIVSTHHQTLKTLAHGREDYISCHVGFDSERNAPTYKLIYGFPGKSMALEVFKEMMAADEKCQHIYNEAVKRLDNKAINYEKLLHQLSAKEEKLNKLIFHNEQINKELKNQKESAKAVAKLKIEDEVSRVKEQLLKITRQAKDAFHEARAGKIESKRNLEKRMENVESQLIPLSPKKESPKRAEKAANMPKPKKLVIGNKYYCSFVDQTVTLKEIKRNGEAIVAKGAMKIKCPQSSLFDSVDSKQQQQVVVSASRSVETKLEYDCRGMRLSEFQNLVENVVPDLVSGSVPFVNFIHGHGNGTLKDWIRSYVKKNAEIEWDPGESGNDGETRIVSNQ